MGMLREVDKTGMGADCDQLSGSEQLLGIDDIPLTLHIDITVDCFAAIKDCLLFCSNTLQVI